MELGILVNSDERLADVLGMTHAALKAGFQVRIFPMDSGTKFLEKEDFTSLSSLDGVKMAYCALSAENWKVDTSGVPKVIKAGDQYDNSQMQNEADKIIIL